jgi:hypothetical protein
MIYLLSKKAINPHILPSFVLRVKDLENLKNKSFFLISRVPENWNQLEDFSFIKDES